MAGRVPLVAVLTAAGVLGMTVCGVARGQDGRTVTEPRIPAACATVAASKVWKGTGSLPADAEGRLDTKAIQSAIDGCAAGQAVILKVAGSMNALLTGPLVLHTGVTLVVDAGVTLVASRNPRDYDSADVKAGSAPPVCGTLAAKSAGCEALITAVRASGSGVMGQGVIEGRGGEKILGGDATWWELAERSRQTKTYQVEPRLIQTDRTDNFTLYGVTLRNAPQVHVGFRRGAGFTAWGVKIDTPLTARNTDGIDPSEAQDVTITQSWFRTGDDDIAIKGPKGTADARMTISHNHFLGGHGMTIGSETEGGVSGVRVTDLTIEHNDLGLVLRSNPLHGGEVKDVVYEDVCIRDTRQPIWFSTRYTDSLTSADKFAGQSHFARFTDITLRNVRVSRGDRLVLLGVNAEMPEEIRLDGVQIDGVEQMKQQVAFAKITLGPGPVNWVPKGQEVSVTGVAGKGKVASCDGRWKDWPKLAAK